MIPEVRQGSLSLMADDAIIDGKRYSLYLAHTIDSSAQAQMVDLGDIPVEAKPAAPFEKPEWWRDAGEADEPQ